MSLSHLTHVWAETPQMSDALTLLPDHVTVLLPEAGGSDPIASALPAQAILASSGIQYNQAIFDRLPNLRIIVRTGIGIDNVDPQAATDHGVLFCNTPDGPTESTAEHTVALMLAAAKQLKPGMEQLAAGKFAPRGLPLGNELMGKTLGLVGLGRIGGRVAHICGKGFGMTVLAYDPYISAERAAELGVTQAGLEEVIAGADFLSVHAPNTQETYHLINRESIATMKDGAYLLNLARGPLVDGEALLEALDNGKLAGAGLDVFEPEPPAVESRLRTHPKIVATPHSATTTHEARARIERMAVEEILAFFTGQPARSPINREVIGRA